MTMTDIVWQDWRYEAGSYDCRVTRAGDHGRLTVTLTTPDIPVPIHHELVECDRAQDERWRARCLDVITHPDLRSET